MNPTYKQSLQSDICGLLELRGKGILRQQYCVIYLLTGNKIGHEGHIMDFISVYVLSSLTSCWKPYCPGIDGIYSEWSWYYAKAKIIPGVHKTNIMISLFWKKKDFISSW